MIKLSLDDDSKQRIDHFVRQVEAFARPDDTAIGIIQDAIRASFEINFATESDNGAKWAPLALRTMHERRILGFPMDHPILVRTGSYRESFLNPSHPDHISEVLIAGGRWEITEGSNDYRAGELEYGRWNMPARPVADLDDSAGEQRTDQIIQMLIDQWFDE